MKSKKTAIFVAPYFPPMGGGLERYTYKIGKNLSETHGWRIVIITSGERYGKDVKEEFEGLTVYRLSYQYKLSNTPFSFDWFKKIKVIFAEEKADLINIHMPVPGIGDIAGMAAGKKPLLVTYHSGTMHKNKMRDDIFIWLYEHGPLKALLRRADRIICSSDFIRFEFLKHYIYKSITIMPGVDTDFFMPDPKKKAGDPTLLFVAGLAWSQEQKGLNILLDAMRIALKTIPTLKLTVVGGGNIKDEYNAYAHELGIEDAMNFTGRLDGADILAPYQSAHVFVLPSLNEGLGMVILEAMACELPPVATNVGGIPSIINDGKDGFLIPPRDPEALAKKIIDVFNDPARATAIGKAVREKMVNEFNWEARAALYDQVLIKALGNKVKHTTRITVISSYFYPKIGGLENYAYLLAKNLHTSGNYEVSVVTSNHEGGGYRQEIIDGITVHRLPIWMKISNTPVNPRWYGALKKIFAVEQPDIVHIHSPVPFLPDLAAYAAGDRAVVLTYHSGSMLKGKWPVDAVIGLYEKLFLPILFKRADAVVAVSQEFARRTFPQFANKIYFIPTGVDLNRFKKTPLPESTEIVSFVGRIEHSSTWKGIEPLLQAMVIVIEHRPNATLELIGGGDAIPHYRKRAEELGIATAVTFVGPQLGQNLVDAYARGSMIVLPSTSDSEAFSIALIEAMASGRPIIGTNIGGTPQVIENGKNGLLVPPKNPVTLAEAIERVLADKTFARSLADYGAMKAQGFSWDIQTKKYSELFDKVL